MRDMALWLLLASTVCFGPAAADQPRWYNNTLVAQGKPLFETHCASCHGQKGEGAPNWQEPLPDGKLPPPPLNGSGHTWHHPLRILARQVQIGGVPLGGSMPAFKDQLDIVQIQAIIAYFQSLWSEDIYHLWLQRGGLPQ